MTAVRNAMHRSNTSKGTPPRFRDEVSSSTAPIALTELEWAGSSSPGSVWAIDGSSVLVAIPLASTYPEVGSDATITMRVGSQTVSFSTIVTGTSEIHGSTMVISCQMKGGHRQLAPNLQKRANTRFTPGTLFPAFCFAYDPINRRILPFSVIDISNGGVALSTAVKAPLLPGLSLLCRFEVPSVGSFNASLVVRHVKSDVSEESTAYRVSAEFEGLDDHARQILGSCLVRPTATNPFLDLLREKLVPNNWLELIEASSTSSRDANAFENEDAAFTHERIKIVGRLGDTLVFSCILCPDRMSKTSVRDLFIHPGLDRAGLGGRIVAEIDRCCDVFGIERAELLDVGLALPRSERSVATRRSSRPRGYVRLLSTSSSRSAQSTKVQWDEYAEAYDTMCSVNLAYQENLARFRDWLETLRLGQDSTICDVGAGTGNYVLEIAKKFPQSKIIHLDTDPMMNRTASRKYRSAGIGNVNFSTQNALRANIEPSSLDLIVCVNALYTFGDVSTVLSNWHSWLKPGGQMFLIDLGRPMDVWSWTRYILASNIRVHGLKATAIALLKGRKAIGQNRLIRKQQEQGNYWLHSTDAFEDALTELQFKVSRIESCYRGACDLAICSKE